MADEKIDKRRKANSNWREMLDDTSTIMTDTYTPHLLELVKNQSKLQQLLTWIAQMYMKNAAALETYYIGTRVYINDTTDWPTFWRLVNLNPKDVKKTIMSAPRFKDVKGMMDQFVTGSILLLLSGALRKINKEDAAKFVFLFTYLKPYSSQVTNIFPIIPSEATIDTMMNQILDNKSTLKKYGSLKLVLQGMADSAWDGELYGVQRKLLLSGRITDDRLWVIFQNTIYGGVKQFLKTIYVQHEKAKAIPIKYTKDLLLTNSDGGESVIDTSNSETDAKNRIIDKIIKAFALNPVRDDLLYAAMRQLATNYQSGKTTFNRLKTMLIQVLDTEPDKINALISYLICAFLDSSDPVTGKKYTIKELRTAIFPAKIINIIYKTKNTINQNIIEAKKIVADLLVNYNICTFEQVKSDGTQCQQYRKAIVIYIAYFIQKNM